MIRFIQPQSVVENWDRIKPLIDKALTKEFYDAEDIKHLCLSGMMMVFVAQDYQAVATVELINHPKQKAALVHTLGGDGMEEWVDELLEEITKIAKSNGANSIQINGRRGWLKRLDGFKEAYTTMVKRI